MSQVKISGNASGTGVFTIAAPNSNTDRTLTLPTTTGTLVTSNAQTILQFAYGEEKARLTGTTNNFLTVVSGVGYTPTSSTTKSLIQGQVSIQPNTGNEAVLRLYVSTNGGSTWTSIGESTATTNLAGVSLGYAAGSAGWYQFTVPFTYLHVHGTTSALQYRVSITPQDVGGTTFYVNGSVLTSGNDSAAGISTLSVMEIYA